MKNLAYTFNDQEMEVPIFHWTMIPGMLEKKIRLYIIEIYLSKGVCLIVVFYLNKTSQMSI